MASRIGQGEFRNVYGSNGSNVTAGQQDYAERMNQIENQREAYYRKARVAPGLPTMKGSYADPEVTGVGYNVLIDSLGDHSVPENWVQHPVVNTEEGTNPGAPLAWGSPENPDDAVAGYGYVPCDTSEVEETFYYHSDHLGSTAYITDQKANVTQYDAYLPYGELLVDEHSSSTEMPYKFNGKELDEETGLYYYGARYMNPLTSMWYGVDPLAEKYVLSGSYVYCLGNPVKLFDPDGRSTWVVQMKNGKYKVVGGNLDDRDKHIYVGHYNSNKKFVKEKAIGVTTSMTSFYNSDIDKWSGTIDVNDKRGDQFLTHIISKRLKLVEYMKHGVTGGLYDFKATNWSTKNYLKDIKSNHSNKAIAELIEKAKRNEYIYRGMPVGINASGENVYTSARDIGNIAAGYVAGINNLPYHTARLGFDGYQGGIEGPSTRNAEWYGYNLGVQNTKKSQRTQNFWDSLKECVKGFF